jgi:hypothetical protein
MNLGIRHFIFENGGVLKRLSQRVHDSVYFSDGRLPQYAGQNVRIATAFIDLADGAPEVVRRIDAEIWHFDETGARRPEAYGPGHPIHRDRSAKASAPQTVVDVTSEMAARRWDRENRWTPTDADVTRMINVIWPKQAGRTIAAPPLVESPEKRRPPMTFAAKRTLDEFWRPSHEIISKLALLGEKDLKAFIAGVAEKSDPFDPIGNALWNGIAAAAQKELEIRQARKSPKGTWFAALEKTEHQTCSTVEYAECDGRAAAEKAARALLVKHASLFSATTTIEALLYPKIEWPGP